MMHSPRKDNVRLEVIRRIVIYGILFFLLAVLQCAFFTQLTLFGAVPDLILGAVCGVAMLDSREAAMICGIASGFLIDALGSTGLSLSPLLLLLLAMVISVLATKMLSNFLCWLALLGCGAVCGAVITAIEIALSTKSLHLACLLPNVLLPELAATVLGCALLYYPLRLAVYWADSKSKFRM